MVPEVERPATSRIAAVAGRCYGGAAQCLLLFSMFGELAEGLGSCEWRDWGNSHRHGGAHTISPLFRSSAFNLVVPVVGILHVVGKIPMGGMGRLLFGRSDVAAGWKWIAVALARSDLYSGDHRWTSVRRYRSSKNY